MKVATLRHEFVESFPRPLAEGVLYVSMGFASSAHLCACGCGAEVVTPLTPTDWKLWFDGVSVSLDPSIGNWRLPCRSHYFITRNRVRWALPMTEREIARGRKWSSEDKRSYFEEVREHRQDPDDCQTNAQLPPGPPIEKTSVEDRSSWFMRLIRRLRTPPE